MVNHLLSVPSLSPSASGLARKSARIAYKSFKWDTTRFTIAPLALQLNAPVGVGKISCTRLAAAVWSGPKVWTPRHNERARTIHEGPNSPPFGLRLRPDSRAFAQD